VVWHVGNDDQFLEELLRQRSGSETAARAKPPAGGEPCADPETLAAYAEGGLARAERRRFEAHLAACYDCQQAVVRLVRLTPRSGDLEAARRQPAPRFGLFRWQWAVPALAGIVLVGSFVYWERERITRTGVEGLQQAHKSAEIAVPPPSARAPAAAEAQPAKSAAAASALVEKDKRAAESPRAESKLEERAAKETTVPAAAGGFAPAPAAERQSPAAAAQLSQAPGGALRQQAMTPPAPSAPPAPVRKAAEAGYAPAPLTEPAGAVAVQADAARSKAMAMAFRDEQAQEQKRAEAPPASTMARGGTAGAGAARAAARTAESEKKPGEAANVAGLQAAPAAPVGGIVARRQDALDRFAKMVAAGSERIALTRSGQLLTAAAASGQWQPLSTPEGAEAIDISIVGANLWVLLRGGRVAHSADLGRSWRAVADTGAEDAVSILFSDSRNGEIRTRSGRRLRTTDGGQSWKTAGR
jgi:hypothetical protein